MSIKVPGTVQGRWGMASNDNVFIIHSSNTEPIKCLCGKLFKELGKRQRLSVSGVGVEQHHEGGPHLGSQKLCCQTPSLSKRRLEIVTFSGSHGKLVTELRATVQVSKALSRALSK